jgi:hypothetical protein
MMRVGRHEECVECPCSCDVQTLVCCGSFCVPVCVCVHVCSIYLMHVCAWSVVYVIYVCITYVLHVCMYVCVS